VATPQKIEPRWERRKEARPSELLEAALDLFVERGYAATRLEDVASRAGVSKGTLYLYFENKEDLFKAVVRGGIVPAIEQAEQLVDQFQGNATDLLREIVLGWWNLIGGTSHAGITKLIISESRNFPEIATFWYEDVVVRANRMFARALKRGVDSAEFRTMDIEYTVRVMMAPVIMLMLWSHSLGACERTPVDTARYLENYLQMLLGGIRSHPVED
jgi:AcrR family transcriptional regulator